jgi:hypothetical protein
VARRLPAPTLVRDGGRERLKPVKPGTPIAERPLRKTEEGCWEWLGSTTGGGYGHFRCRGRFYGAHRQSYVEARGPIPEGLWVLHRCDNRLCVNPDHLFLGTPLDNVRDMMAKGRDWRGLPKTQCKRGHPYTPEHGYHNGRGWRCRTCDTIRRPRYAGVPAQ